MSSTGQDTCEFCEPGKYSSSDQSNCRTCPSKIIHSLGAEFAKSELLYRFLCQVAKHRRSEDKAAVCAQPENMLRAIIHSVQAAQVSQHSSLCYGGVETNSSYAP